MPGLAGPPVFLSNAHFCDVDPAVADTVVGLNCSMGQHVTFLDVEPTTGITMRAAKRLMMSTEYGPGTTLPSHYIPCLYHQQYLTVCACVSCCPPLTVKVCGSALASYADVEPEALSRTKSMCCVRVCYIAACVLALQSGKQWSRG